MAIHEFFSDLFQRYLDNNCSPEEVDQLFALIATSEYAGYAKELIEVRAARQIEGMPNDLLLKERLDARLQLIFEAAVVPMKQKSWVVRIAAAAAVLVLMSAGTYFLLKNKTAIKTGTQVVADVAPGGNKAVLTLGNGNQIILDSAGNGMLAQQAGSNVFKTDSGKLAYKKTIEKPTEIVFNTLTTPRGGQYQLVLPDGTKVWLNAASSIKYPTAFTGKERVVEITGEAYFDVVHNDKQPFKVKAGNQFVQDIGTEFDVMAYPEENTIKTTLIHGAVKVESNKQSVLLKVGQQAQLNNEGLTVVDGVNVDEVVAWKNGFFDLESASLETILRQYARWYDVEVTYEGKPKERKFFAIVKRNSSLKSVLDMLGDNDIKYRIEGKKLIIHSE